MTAGQYVSGDLVFAIRIFSIISMIVLTTLYVFSYAVPRWPFWEVKERLIWFSHVMFCLYFILGTLEFLYLDTSFRVLLASAAILCLLTALAWPKEDRSSPERE